MTIHLSVTVLILFGVALAGFGLLFWLRLQSASGSIACPVSDPALLATPISTNNRLPSPPESPLATVDFDMALKSDALLEEVSRFGREALNYSLAVQGVNLAVQSIAAGESLGTLNIVYEFSSHGRKMVERGVATVARHAETGQYLPELQDRTGRFVELAKGHTNVVGRLANISALVVSVAHIISSADTLKRLKRIESKLDQLIAGRMNDQISTLESIYVGTGRLMRESCFGRGESTCERYRDELYKLRVLWRREVERILGIALDLALEEWWNRPNLKEVLKWTPGLGQGAELLIEWIERKRRQRKERDLLEHLTPLIEIVYCLRLALLIEACIAQWTGSIEELYSHTLRNEAAMWNGVVRLLDDCRATRDLSDSSENIGRVQLILAAIDAYVEALTGATCVEGLA